MISCAAWRPSGGLIAVKVINHLAGEVMKVLRIKYANQDVVSLSLTPVGLSVQYVYLTKRPC